MKITVVQVLIDFIGMQNVLIKFTNAASRQSSNSEQSGIYVNISIESRIFIEQLNAEINVQRKILDDLIEIEPLENLIDVLLVENHTTNSRNTVLARADNPLTIITNNYSKVLKCRQLPPTTLTLLTTQYKILEKYLRDLRTKFGTNF